MTAATADRNTRQKAGERRGFPVAAATLIYAGTMAAISTATGLLTKGATSTTLQCVGVAKDRIDNSAGAASAITGETEIGVFGPFANSSAGDLIAAKDVGKDCYMVDDQTVALTNGGATRSKAGVIWDVDAGGGVWVKFA